MLIDPAIRVMYDPVGYYRPWRRSLPHLSAQQRVALNAHLLTRHALPFGEKAIGALLGTHARRILERWHALPDAAYLVACAKWRAHLAADRQFMRLPALVHGFLALGFSEATPLAEDMDRDKDAWVARGGAYLMEGLPTLLPAWMSARLPLLFARSHGEPLPASGHGDFDFTCFWSALTYAANHRELCH
ncbi:MAG TPA: hypothetical protein VIM98_20295 [Dyella sp.]|uniref:hypothetical protein n=1 Tax=Dyella sp. TaxID=1869338 RepID=UPI002F930C4A